MHFLFYIRKLISLSSTGKMCYYLFYLKRIHLILFQFTEKSIRLGVRLVPDQPPIGLTTLGKLVNLSAIYFLKWHWCLWARRSLPILALYVFHLYYSYVTKNFMLDESSLCVKKSFCFVALVFKGFLWFYICSLLCACLFYIWLHHWQLYKVNGTRSSWGEGRLIKEKDE